MPDVSSTNVRFSTRISNRLRGVSRLSPTATAGVVIILLFGILAIFSGLFMTHDPFQPIQIGSYKALQQSIGSALIVMEWTFSLV